MLKHSGARNTVGFSSSIQQGSLPNDTHLTYEGVFNELKFNVGPKTKETIDLTFSYSRFQFTNSVFDKSISDYLGIFVKGKGDGADRSQDIRLNVVICLDVSGSMKCGLGGMENNSSNRLKLAIDAIKLLIPKLKQNDSIGMVTFDNQAQVIFEQQLKSQLPSDIYQRLHSIRAAGGTTIINGFKKSKQLLLNWINKNGKQKCQNRIIMLTDVCDNSIASEKTFINEAADIDNIHVSIVGISTQFQSSVCQGFKDIKGFNYFCAVKEEDIQKYLFQTFDFGFFPSAYNIQIRIVSQDVQNIQVFGTPDSDKVIGYNKDNKNYQWTVTRMESCFPSQVQMHGDQMHIIGGLILIKLKRKSKAPFFRGKVHLSYKDVDQKNEQSSFDIFYQFHPEQQFFSDDNLREAVQGFIFTSQLKHILTESKLAKSKQQIYERFWPMLCDLSNLCPKSKLKDLQNIKKIIKSYQKVVQEGKQYVK